MKAPINTIPAIVLPVGFLSFLCFGLVMISTAIFVSVRWLRWKRSQESAVVPRWRGALALAGFSLATLSLLAAVALWFHAMFTGGFPFYHPVLLFWLRVGFWTAMMGLAFGLIGKGQLRLPTIICSIVCFLVWLSEAMPQ
jgi:hypothetical protein